MEDGMIHFHGIPAQSYRAAPVVRAGTGERANLLHGRGWRRDARYSILSPHNHAFRMKYTTLISVANWQITSAMRNS